MSLKMTIKSDVEKLLEPFEVNMREMGLTEGVINILISQGSDEITAYIEQKLKEQREKDIQIVLGQFSFGPNSALINKSVNSTAQAIRKQNEKENNS
jgi:hypothetical protein